ncbi:acyl-CoA dehydrogenase family protein [Pyrobaculum calidifontis]|uniref:Acyl-CoA dehydrogenase domain protein n=1 Tax=Pyrobaculum calidifontis (strain DSM 21063 / JCM 11548 / VA1) TaxID=410359 RepID=A3MSI7_PYRCJ|nr:acyl-CoA dehydrogenase family protein [Pyrobaculum calidifontis]ABO07604.1 acyl-CoA dehydrogenase domain protein [Pyrobaculum calidifontis JCM 11548]
MLDEEHRLILKSVREFTELHVRPRAREIDRGVYPREILRKLGELGLLAPTIPPEFNGGGSDTLTQVLVVEELARASPGVATIMEIQSSMIAENIYAMGNPRQREELLPKFASGELICAFALSEPCCGSDAGAIETRAVRVGGEWRISGVKMWITSGLYADYYLVFARTGPKEARHKAITAFLVKRGSCVEATPIEVMGVRGTGTAEVKFNECPANDDDIVGKINEGWAVVVHALNVGRAAISGVAVGIARGAFEEALSWARGRRLFGKTLIEFQNTQFELAEMYAAIETARTLTYYAAYLYDVKSPDFVAMAHVAKLQTARIAVDVARRAVQLEGGYGYSKESKAEMFYRDAKILEIGEGTNEVMKYVLFKLLEKR